MWYQGGGGITVVAGSYLLLSAGSILSLSAGSHLSLSPGSSPGTANDFAAFQASELPRVSVPHPLPARRNVRSDGKLHQVDGSDRVGDCERFRCFPSKRNPSRHCPLPPSLRPHATPDAWDCERLRTNDVGLTLFLVCYTIGFGVAPYPKVASRGVPYTMQAHQIDFLVKSDLVDNFSGPASSVRGA